ncbi:MAG TPA: cytochrome c oxidase assembly protein [Acidimicrobiales bacterium]|nr:cytochrome c oxidase assembly protein [Acidimicrobiales bacterium]
MTWWCSATRLPWDWAPRAYPGVWLVMAGLMSWYVLARRRLTPEERAVEDRRRPLAFAGGWVALWVATDWPLGALGSGYLASAHMVQYLLYTQVAAPLLVLGLNEPMLRRLLARTRTTELVRLLTRPVAAVVLFNAVLIATHAPVTVDALRTSQAGSFVLDGLWLLSGLILWLPVCGPLDEIRPSYPVRAVLLFVGAGVVPMIPGGFLTFATTPLYGIYELAPRVGGFDAGVDQQLAGVLMKIGNVPLLWPAIGVLFARWAKESGASGSEATLAGTNHSV